MSKTTLESFELGNLCFGNSRGPYEFPDRNLVNSDEWDYLVNTLLQMDYHGMMEDFYYDHETCKNKERDNGLAPSLYGGYICEDLEGNIVFEIFPYYWDDCTCGADQYNESLEEKLKTSIFSEKERKIYEAYDTWCKDECPACSWKPENKEKSLEELHLICTCGAVEENIKLVKQKESMADKIKEYETKYNELCKAHSSDCLLLKHNFIYKPGTKDEFWIDWYKYPFRNSFMSMDISIEEIKRIWLECQEAVKNNIERKK